jgi:hypothetical protein
MKNEPTAATSKMDFILRVDVDVANAFADMLCKVAEISPESLATC